MSQKPEGAEIEEARLKQVIVAPFSNDKGMTYSTIGLSEDGKVYRYDLKCEGWIPWSIRVADCRDEHKGRR